MRALYSSPMASLVLTDSSQLTSISQHLAWGHSRTCCDSFMGLTGGVGSNPSLGKVEGSRSRGGVCTRSEALMGRLSIGGTEIVCEGVVTVFCRRSLLLVRWFKGSRNRGRQHAEQLSLFASLFALVPLGLHVEDIQLRRWQQEIWRKQSHQQKLFNPKN
uniref:Uncharacterized protein n=1 Tax=Timema shepardi TaxID=629360 RepID=A0A7R9B410_TIMSH|nr:unnamed protein product [Timema shepardi]